MDRRISLGETVRSTAKVIKINQVGNRGYKKNN